MLTSEQIDTAARHLVKARQTQTKGELIPQSARPADNESALAVQDRVMELLGELIGGWKCGVPLANGSLVIAPLPESAVLHTSPCKVPPPVGKIEPEIAFVMLKDLPPRGTPYSDDEIRGAVKEGRMVLELLGTRYEDRFSATPVDLLADHFNNHALYVGPVVPSVFDLSLEKLPVKITAGGKVLYDKTTPHPSGGPMNSIRWLVGFLNQRGTGVRAGQVITTGSYAGIVEAPIGVPLEVELGGVGSFPVELS